MMKDFIGQEVQVGDTIVYVTRSGSSIAMTLARVEAIEPGKNLYYTPSEQLRVRPLERSRKTYSGGKAHKTVILRNPMFYIAGR